jgi:hypothetical protein
MPMGRFDRSTRLRRRPEVGSEGHDYPGRVNPAVARDGHRSGRTREAKLAPGSWVPRSGVARS